MLLGLNTELENSIIIALSGGGYLSADEVLSTVNDKGKAITLQGLYRVLKKLQDEKVITKERRTYSLRLPWIIELTQFAEQLETTYLHSNHLTQLLPTSSIQKRVWRFNNLMKMVEAWMQIVVAMGKVSENKTALTYAPHLWFALIHLPEWLQFKKALGSLVKKQYTLIHGTQYVDKYLNALTKHPDEIVYLTKDEYFEDDLTLYRTIIDDTIITVRLDPVTAHKINTLFEQIKSEDTMYLLDIFQTFTGKVRVTLMIKKDPIIANRYRKKFERLFGPIR